MVQYAANVLKIRSFKEVQKPFDQRFQDSFANKNDHLENCWKVQNWRIKFKSKQRSLRSQENRTYINLQEKLIEAPRISARKKNGLSISKSTFKRINKHYLKWHLYKVHVRKEITINNVDLLEKIRVYLKELW